MFGDAGVRHTDTHHRHTHALMDQFVNWLLKQPLACVDVTKLAAFYTACPNAPRVTKKHVLADERLMWHTADATHKTASISSSRLGDTSSDCILRALVRCYANGRLEVDKLQSLLASMNAPSKSALKRIIRSVHVALGSGQICGSRHELVVLLRTDAHHRVRASEVKEYPLVKRLLVRVFSPL